MRNLKSAMFLIENKVLRPIAEANYLQDPLRVIRVARFAACFPDFTLHSSWTAIAARIANENRLRQTTPERVGNETRKACACARPSRFFRVLAGACLLEPWFVELKKTPLIPAGPPPFHNQPVLGHLSDVMDRVAGDALKVWMGLCHDLGKAVTPEATWPR